MGRMMYHVKIFLLILMTKSFKIIFCVDYNVLKFAIFSQILSKKASKQA